MIRVTPDYSNKKVYMNIDKAPLFFRSGIRNALYEIGNENSKQLKKFIKDPPHTGRIYPVRGNLGDKHQASAPGESPANQTGKLMKTVHYKVRGSSEVEFGDKEHYGAYLEEGVEGITVGGKQRRILPRPHVIRTVKKKQRDNYRSMVNNVKERIIRT